MDKNYACILRFCAWRALVLIASLLASLAAADETPPGFRAYPLRHVNAGDIATRVREALADTGAQAQVFVDPQTNRLLVSGSDDVQRLAGQLLATMDQPVAGPDSAPPATRGTEVKGYRVAANDLHVVAKHWEEQFAAQGDTRIVVDERTQQVIVVAPIEVHREIARQLQNQIKNALPAGGESTPTAARSAPTATYQLQHISVVELEEELRRFWGDQLDMVTSRNGELASVSLAGPLGSRPILQIDRRRRMIAFPGHALAVRTWRRFIEAVDAPRDRADNVTQLVSLQNADPAKIQTAVSLLQTADTQRSNENVTAAVRLPSGQVAPPGIGQQSSKVIRPTAQQAQPNQVPPAKPAEPPAAATEKPAVPGAEPEIDDMSGGLIGPVSIEILDPLGIIIIRGNKRDVARVQKIIEEIDKISKETQPEIEIYYLQYVNSEAITMLVSELYTEILSPRQGQVSIRALVEPNAVLLIGRKESLEVVKELIAKLDQPSPPASKFEVFRLKNVSAVDAEQTVRNFFVNRPGFETTVRTGLGTRVQVVADFRTNSLIVQASPRDLEEVRRLIETIDVTSGEATAELRIFKLKNALAQDLATVLQSAISGQQAGAQAPAGQQQPGQQQQQAAGTSSASQARLPSTSLELMVVDQQGGRLLRSGILADVQVTADPSINALVVRAPAKSMELIAALIEQLDKLPDAQAQIKVFTIVNGNAVSLTTMLQQLFGLQTTAQGANQGLLNLGLTQQLQPLTAGGESSLVPLRFAVDQRTNSIIASGTAGDLAVVETILLRLDEDLEDRRLTVVRLRNTQATSVATALQQYLQNLQTQVNQQLLTNQAVTAFEQVERQVIVTPEPITNSIIVSATPRYQDEILKVIQDLDVRRPLVLIQVLIAEITLDDTFEYGSEFGLQDALVFDRGKALFMPRTTSTTAPGVTTTTTETSVQSSTPGFNFGASPLAPYPNVNTLNQGSLAGQSLTNLALGRTSSALGYGGLVLSAANESINLLLRALEEDGRVQILSRPQLMTMHNEPAEVQVGANISRITGSNITQFGVTQNVEDVSTGLILRVLPLINDDDVVVMGIEAVRSALGNEAEGTVVSTTTAGVPIRVAPINITSAEATISARSGQTVVFAGLIQNTHNLRLRRVPYLADLPVLGRLFEFETDFEQRKELLVVMTPYIIRDDADIEMAKLQESARMSWCLSDVVSVTGDWGLEGGNCLFCTKKSPLIFPDCDPTGIGFMPMPPSPVEDSTSSLMHPSSRRGMEPQHVPVSTEGETDVGPPQPVVDSARLLRPRAAVKDGLLPATDIEGQPALRVGVSPANYQSPGIMRLPAPN